MPNIESNDEDIQHTIQSIDQIIQEQREDLNDYIQVLDNIPIIAREAEIADKTDISDRGKRRIKAAKLTWAAITHYVQHNYLEEWILRMSKYFNKFTKIGNDIWDEKYKKAERAEFSGF